jgi:hypothetical protein
MHLVLASKQIHKIIRGMQLQGMAILESEDRHTLMLYLHWTFVRSTPVTSRFEKGPKGKQLRARRYCGPEKETTEP